MKLSDNPSLEAKIESRIEVWHSTPQSEDLHDALGMTIEDYAIYVMKNEVPDNYIFPE